MMKNAKKKRRSKPLYHAAKISDYRFKKIIWHFVRDHSASETARATKLSVNAVHAIFRKIRIYFYEVGLFQDFYDGVEPEDYESDNPLFEFQLLEYHFARVRGKMGLRSPTTEPPYHFAESCWRYDFKVMMNERPSDGIYAMMESHLIEIIKHCGPIGHKPANYSAARQAIRRQFDQRIRWLERNAPGFNTPERRVALRELQRGELDNES